MRVLHCIYDDPQNPWVGGGGAVRVLELYKHLKDRLHVTVASGAFPGSKDEIIDGVQYRRLGSPRSYPWSRITYAREAGQLLSQHSYDAAVFDFSVYTPILVPRGRPIGVTVHHVTGPTAHQRWGIVLGSGITRTERYLLSRARVFSATSRATHDELRRIVRGDKRIVDVAAGVDDSLFAVRRAEQEYLLYFGRLDWFQKGLDVLLNAAAILMAAHPTLELRIAGRGRDADRVEATARELGIRERVTLLGAVSDAERLRIFAGARVLLMPSRFEGFGMVAAEAMAAGVPIVASDAGSLPEVIAPPHGGVLVPEGDPHALARATADLLANIAARDSLSQSARVSAERFRWRVIADRHLDFLRQIATLA